MDIDTLLKSVAPEATPPDDHTIDADLARGRAARAAVHRRHTRRRGGLAVCSLAAAAVGVGLAIGGLGHSASSAPVTGSLRPAPRATVGATHVQLVDYSGSQLPGFTVAEIPSGWHLSTSTTTALLITPDGSSNTDPDDFLGKLAVLTSSNDQPGLGSGVPVTVNGQPGRVSQQDGVLMLDYKSPRGFGVDIQAPDALGWSDAQIVAFANGVEVTSAAVHANG